MLWRFSLYSFLKNQKYYEPFILLAFLEKGLSFTEIGLLIGFRSVCINLLEVPSGAIADLYGRRRLMIASFVSYILSFIIFAVAGRLAWLAGGMFFFSIGEAFRTGTHKAMIFAWLEHEGRAGEKTRFYGYTRSWAQIGSAASVIIAAVIVLAADTYNWVFWASCGPYALGVINFLGYPGFLDGRPAADTNMRAVFVHVWRAVRSCLTDRPLRRLLTESMLAAGSYHTVRDYLQPLLRDAAVALPVLTLLTTERRAAILVGLVYALLYVLSAVASRTADRVAKASGGEDRASAWLHGAALLVCAGMTACLWYGAVWGAIAAFVGLAVWQNMWRPIFLSRMDHHAGDAMGATVLSVDSQAKAVFMMIAAPLLGFAVDLVGLEAAGIVGVIAMVPVLLLTSQTRTAQTSKNG